MMPAQSDFYTPTGIHVYFKDALKNQNIDVEEVVSHLESVVPSHLTAEIEMIIVGEFEEFTRRSINAFYEGGTLYISNIQDNSADMFDDIIHETAHSLEQPYGYIIYGDGDVEKEFLSKRQKLYDILWSNGYRIPQNVLLDPEYNEDLDMFLYKDIGYDKLSYLVQGLFITPYAITSLREYFATGFTDFYLDPNNHSFLKKVSPFLYKKLTELKDLGAN